jgi:hypothetical protein
MATRIVDFRTDAIDYRLNILGIRVWRDACQLISRTGAQWVPIGSRELLPLKLVRSVHELTENWADALRVTAYQFEREYPGSDLIDLLLQKVDFNAALGAEPLRASA